AWAAVIIGVLALFVASFYTDTVIARALALTAGIGIGVLFTIWALGGNVSTFNWWIGAEGERETAKQLKKLTPDWHCEHDLEHAYGNWDHILIGPPGVFLIETKSLNSTATASNDTLRAGRLTYPGSTQRHNAYQTKTLLEQELGYRAPWVQAIVVIH